MRSIVLISLVAALGLSGCAAAAVRAASATRQPDPAQMLARADENGDGVITRAEFASARSRMFARLDRNGDGYLTRDDRPHGFMAQRRGGDGSRLAEAMATLDRDGDGRISRDEFVHGPSLVFERADTNHDGVVDASELAAFRAAVAGR